MTWLLNIPPGVWFAAFGLIVLAGGVALYAATGEPKYRGVHETAPAHARHRFEDLHSPTIVVNVDAYRVKRSAHVEDHERGGPAPR